MLRFNHGGRLLALKRWTCTEFSPPSSADGGDSAVKDTQLDALCFRMHLGRRRPSFRR